MKFLTKKNNRTDDILFICYYSDTTSKHKIRFIISENHKTDNQLQTGHKMVSEKNLQWRIRRGDIKSRIKRSHRHTSRSFAESHRCGCHIHTRPSRFTLQHLETRGLEL